MERKLHCMGIQSWALLLVYQWDLLSGAFSGKLEREVDDLSAM